jgi:hypothetical protein
MVDRESGKGMSITIWTSEESSARAPHRPTSYGAAVPWPACGAQIESAQHYEIGRTVGTPTT